METKKENNDGRYSEFWKQYYMDKSLEKNGGCCGPTFCGLIILLILFIVSCSPKVVKPQPPLPVESHHDTVTLVKEVVRDSIVNHYVTVRDSSSFRRDGDTVTIERWHYERDYTYEKILQAKIDSMSHIKGDSIPYPVEVPVEVPAELTRWQKMMMNMGGLVLYLLIIAAGYGIYRLWRKFKKI